MTGIIRVWRRFLKCRKQNDGVKMIVLFILIGMGFGACVGCKCHEGHLFESAGIRAIAA